jgi:hypothetical protein
VVEIDIYFLTQKEFNPKCKFIPGLHMSLRIRDRVSVLIGSRCWDVAGSPASVAAAAAMIDGVVCDPANLRCVYCCTDKNSI